MKKVEFVLANSFGRFEEEDIHPDHLELTCGEKGGLSFVYHNNLIVIDRATCRQSHAFIAETDEAIFVYTSTLVLRRIEEMGLATARELFPKMADILSGRNRPGYLKIEESSGKVSPRKILFIEEKAETEQTWKLQIPTSVAAA